MARIKPLIPYSVVLVNHSSHQVLAEAVTFSFKLANGETPHQTYAMENFNDGPPFTQIKPGEGRFLTTERSINVYLGRLKSQPEAMDPKALEQFSSLINKASSKSGNSSRIHGRARLRGVGRRGTHRPR